MKKTLLLLSLIAGTAHAYEAQVKKGQLPSTLNAMIEKANQDTGLGFNAANFLKVEERELATSKFTMYIQVNSMIPVARTAIRMWSDIKTGELILGEMHLSDLAKKDEKILAAKFQKARFTPAAIKSKILAQAINKLVASEVSGHGTDNRILGMKSKDQWINGDLVRTVEVRGRRGVHFISISLLKNRVVGNEYQEFPQSEQFHTLKANVFPIYEEVEGTSQKLDYEVRELKYISTQVREGGPKPLGKLTDEKFPESRYSPILAETVVGEMYGLWSEASMRKKVETSVNELPLRANGPEGVLLQGKFATINLHPGVKEAFPEINFKLDPSVNHLISWTQGEDGAYVARPISGLLGKKVESQEELLTRIPVRLADHNTLSYINGGFDEVQVYYGVTVLMEALAEMGFTDPELSSQPFHAFLYDPDISMKDNAYYYDNTINFTTYNPGTPNLARDNPTIWHELGHGVMDRLMGAHLGFAGTKGGYGGLSEGMADFVAMLVVEHQTSGAAFPGKEDFRIMNQTGFYLTNEFHDEGEAYGGVMADMLAKVLATEGKQGLHAFTDLTLEAMRLTRNHPALSARGWFEHMILADELGSAVRAPGQYSELMANALSARNFAFSSEFAPATMKLTFGTTELTNESPASREKPLTPCDASGTVGFDLKLKLTSGDSQFITFPAIVKVEFKKGALQGAIKWEGEESNPTVYEVSSAEDLLTIPVKASMDCETVNQPDGSCKDYAYVQVFNQGDAKPRAKKRFYLKLNKAECAAK
ncbi:MAG TPA: hypothetical protein VNJ08_05740 [Bacteriovoracaceae bacterium]|nr:hypothetical protein [Bacteriovoracaceae bacterium]